MNQTDNNNIQYYDIGVNLFCKQFPEPEQIIREAQEQGVCCILTGTDTRENRKINDFVKTHPVFGKAYRAGGEAEQAIVSP